MNRRVSIKANTPRTTFLKELLVHRTNTWHSWEALLINKLGSSGLDVYYINNESTKVQTLGELRMRGNANGGLGSIGVYPQSPASSSRRV